MTRIEKKIRERNTEIAEHSAEIKKLQELIKFHKRVISELEEDCEL